MKPCLRRASRLAARWAPLCLLAPLPVLAQALPALTSTPPPLPATGADTLPLAGLSLGMLIIGAAGLSLVLGNRTARA